MKSVYKWFFEKFGWEKEELDQNSLIAGILLFVIVLLALFIFLTPGMKGVAVILAKYFVYLFEGIGFLVLGLWFIGNFAVRPFIEFLDENRASTIDLPSWIHWLLAITGSVVFGWMWTKVVVWVLSIGGYLQTLFSNWGWYVDQSVHGLIWWWAVGSIMFFFGYFWKGIRKEFRSY